MTTSDGSDGPSVHRARGRRPNRASQSVPVWRCRRRLHSSPRLKLPLEPSDTQWPLDQVTPQRADAGQCQRGRQGRGGRSPTATKLKGGWREGDLLRGCPGPCLLWEVGERSLGHDARGSSCGQGQAGPGHSALWLCSCGRSLPHPPPAAHFLPPSPHRHLQPELKGDGGGR